jgi:leader peptidase (prepilin peptidase)/N-methyltransferase
VHPLWLLIVACGAFGLAIGSFLNVVIYRVPRKESIVTPPSACPSCGTELAARDNVPVLSWVLLRGKCRTCGAPISWQYPVVELLTAGLFAGVAGRFGYDWAVPAYLALFAGLVALSWIDVERMLLPKAIVYPVSVLVAGLLLIPAGVYGAWHSYWVAWAFAGGWFLLFYLMWFASPRLLGYGDVRLAPVLGLSLGWLGWRYVVLGFLAANFIGAVIGISLIVAKKVERQSRVPYGVFLALGTAVAVFAGPELIEAFTHRGGL